MTGAADTKLQQRKRSDFLFLEELGEGSFSTVHLATEKSSSRKFAVKVCYKQQIIREKRVQQIFREKEILLMLSTKENAHPFIVQLLCTFQDHDSLYFVLTLATRKDLLKKIREHKKNPLTVAQCRFVTAELLSAMSHMHSFHVVHRDIKPENILIKEDGHIMLSDFGCAKRLDAPAATLAQPTPPPPPTKPEGDKDEEDTESGAEDDAVANGSSGPKQRKSSFVGTSHYVSPEVLNGKEVQQACDYWAFAVVLFEMLTNGRRPFSDISEYLIYKRILKLLYSFNDDFAPGSEDAKQLISSILLLEPEKRLGSVERGGALPVKQHKFFADVDWSNLPKQPSPFFYQRNTFFTNSLSSCNQRVQTTTPCYSTLSKARKNRADPRIPTT
ncbi:protein kinase domain-containing protein [Ditylenchus destructor]|uniref:non-specific serine/threonine protein kinase n=1 Tax=Ditylenchus destructor TaxID=166010 RepID=A0AAD4MXI1_9BILA|nr:protein kinase domain-containing protein [Ditylenchus destructor]